MKAAIVALRSRTPRRPTWSETASLVIPAVFAVVIGYTEVAARHEDVLAFDFWRNIWSFDRDVLAGISPYREPAEFEVADDTGVYPPFAPLVFMPLALLPYAPAAAIWSLGLMGALGLGLRLVGLRDWRCYAWLLASLPVLHGVLMLGNITVLLTLCLALAWRWRERPILSGIALGAAFAVKPFLLPLVVWLLATRRYRAAAATLVTTALAVGVSWAAIGFDGLVDYPRLTQVAADLYQSQGVSTVAAAVDIGFSETAGRALAISLGLALVVLVARLARRHDGDMQAFSLSIGAALVLSPVVWYHYLVLLLVPVAIRFPRFGPIWLLPVVLWVSQGPWVFLSVSALMLTATTLRTNAATGLVAIPTGQLSSERIR